MPYRHRFRIGISIVEILLCLAIAGLLLALLQPVIRGAKRSAKYTEVVNHLRQQHLAISLYRADWGAIEMHGTPIELGLPPTSVNLHPTYAPKEIAMETQDSDFKAFKEKWQVWPTPLFHAFYDETMPDWMRLQRQMETKTPLIAMLGFQDHVPLTPTMIAHIRWIGFDGAIHSRRAPGFKCQIDWFFD